MTLIQDEADRQALVDPVTARGGAGGQGEERRGNTSKCIETALHVCPTSPADRAFEKIPGIQVEIVVGLSLQ
eukprot:97500-Hanusia_phi.AAC.1